jgi:hypothetical protein
MADALQFSVILIFAQQEALRGGNRTKLAELHRLILWGM